VIDRSTLSLFVLRMVLIINRYDSITCLALEMEKLCVFCEEETYHKPYFYDLRLEGVDTFSSEF